MKPPPLRNPVPPFIPPFERRIHADSLLGLESAIADLSVIAGLSEHVSSISATVSTVGGDVASVEAHVNAVSNAVSAIDQALSNETSVRVVDEALLSGRIDSAVAMFVGDIDGGDADAVFGGVPFSIDGGGA